MAQIEFRLPSAIPYAYVNVTGTPEEIAQINFELLASLYANSLNAFQAAEEKAARLIVQGEAAKPVELPSEPPSEDPAAEVKEQLGATELDSVNAPWEAPQKAPKQKAWEKKKPAAKLNIDPDFF